MGSATLDEICFLEDNGKSLIPNEEPESSIIIFFPLFDCPFFILSPCDSPDT